MVIPVPFYSHVPTFLRSYLYIFPVNRPMDSRPSASLRERGRSLSGVEGAVDAGRSWFCPKNTLLTFRGGGRSGGVQNAERLRLSWFFVSL